MNRWLVGHMPNIQAHLVVGGDVGGVALCGLPQERDTAVAADSVPRCPNCVRNLRLLVNQAEGQPTETTLLRLVVRYRGGSNIAQVVRSALARQGLQVLSIGEATEDGTYGYQERV